ncbi:hypothetical protein M0657_010731 [Pyricularia oryzae]|nr:hypothetical protein M0657_010731 [Pyricularia oryzae]
MKLTSVGAFSAAYVVCAVSAASQDYNTTLQTRQYSTKPLDTEIGFYPIELCVDISFGGCKPGGAKWGECLSFHLNTGIQDKISSLKTGTRRCIFFEHSNCWGKQGEYKGDVPWVGNELNDIFSSFICFPS